MPTTPSLTPAIVRNIGEAAEPPSGIGLTPNVVLAPQGLYPGATTFPGATTIPGEPLIRRIE